MQSKSILFKLPRELRDIIYEQYLTLDMGYVFNPKSGKLITNNERQIDLALCYTCKTIAAEIQGLPLQLNTIHFSTSFDKSARSTAGSFNALIGTLHSIKNSLLQEAHSCIDEETMNLVDTHYPQFQSLIRYIQVGGDFDHFYASSQCWSEPGSLHRQFVRAILAKISTHTEFQQIISESIIMSWMVQCLNEKVFLDYTLWDIPTEDDVTNLVHVLQQEGLPDDLWNYDIQKYRFSAAAVAIQWLAALPTERRLQIRKIALNEDRRAIAWPECHGLGLIPFCKENPRLRVERKVSLWRNAFLAGSAYICTFEEADSRLLDRLRAVDVSQGCISPWINEALALSSFGMPVGAFTLILDGSPTPEKSSKVWRIVQRDAAWQAAFEDARATNKSQPILADWMETRNHRCYIARGFPEAIRDINNGDSLIKCNFDTGEPWDVEEIVQQSENWTMEEWKRHWFDHEPINFQTSPPLLSWIDLQREDLVSS